jgi:aryl-alcohol dehydrogenase-like predicted oxidoreductase
VYSPLASGLLTDSVLGGAAGHALSGSRLRERADYPELTRLVRSLSFLSVPGIQSLSQASYRFILMHPGVTSVLGGFSELSHLDEALTATTAGPLTQHDLVRLDTVWRSSFIGSQQSAVSHQ